MRSTPLNTEAAGAAPPDAFGPFRVLHQIGAGTLGPVFRAYDPEQDRLVAVKLFTLNLPPERAHRFVASLQQLVDADLAHPAMAAPILAGLVDVAPFLAQDFVAADSLDTIVREFGAASAVDAARVAGQLAGALDFAAAAGVCHGALHPRDVLLVSDDARMTGLGIAQALDAIGVMPPVRRPYAPPERVSGLAWDRRADIYSLAVLLVEMMTGRRPAGAASLDGCFDAMAQPAALRAVFARAMAERPDERFETAMAFAEAMKRVVDAGTANGAAHPVAAAARTPPAPAALPLDLPVARRLPIDEPLRGAMPELLPGDVPPVHLPVHIDDASDLPLDAAVAETASGRAADWDLRATDSLVDLAQAPPLAIEAPAAAAPPANDATIAAPADVAPVASAPPATGAPAVASVVVPPASSPVWPIPLALLVGVIVGIAVGFFVFANRAEESAASPALETASAPAASGAAVPGPAAAGAAAPAVVTPPVTPAPTVPAPSAAAVQPREPDAPVAPPARATERAAPRPADPRRAAAPARTAAVSGRVLVRTSPAGARVQLNGRDVGQTPTTLRTLPFGTHTLRLTRDGYAAEERRVVLSASQPSQSVAVDLARTRAPAAAATSGTARFTAALTVESRPAGATVFLDGRRIGTTPLTVSSIEAGSHVVRLELDGYRHWSSAVRVASDERNRVTASLEQ